MNTTKVAYTVKVAAEAASVTPAKVYDAIRSGQLPAIDLSGTNDMRPQYRVMHDDLVAWLRSLRVAA